MYKHKTICTQTHTKKHKKRLDNKHTQQTTIRNCKYIGCCNTHHQRTHRETETFLRFYSFSIFHLNLLPGNHIPYKRTRASRLNVDWGTEKRERKEKWTHIQNTYEIWMRSCVCVWRMCMCVSCYVCVCVLLIPQQLCSLTRGAQTPKIHVAYTRTRTQTLSTTKWLHQTGFVPFFAAVPDVSFFCCASFCCSRCRRASRIS